jgi:Domain of unknown function (DUF5664)
MMENSEGAIKHDQEKIRLELLSAQWVEGVGQVLTAGAKRYADHNWRKGLKRTRLLGACLRHVFAYLSGTDVDPETGLLHLYHASCCLMFASELHFSRPDLDDRYKPERSFGERLRDEVRGTPFEAPEDTLASGWVPTPEQIKKEAFIAEMMKNHVEQYKT